MYRNILIAGMSLVGLVWSSTAIAQTSAEALRSSWSQISSSNSDTGREAFRSTANSTRYVPPLPRADLEQMVRWKTVGDCVAARDHDASLDWINTPRGSVQFATAAAKVSPAFDQCARGAGLSAPRDKTFRRAALADALGVPLKD